MGMELDLNAILHGSPAEVSGDAPRPCCSPTQFEGTLSELDTYYKKGGFFHHGKGGVVSSLIGLSYDGENKLVAMDEHIYARNHSMNQKVILNFQEKQIYVIRDSRCVTTKLRQTFKPSCLPKNATYTGSYYLGSGANKVSMNGFQVAYPLGDEEGVLIYASVQSNNCLFVSEVHMGRMKKAKFFGVLSLVDATLGIKDPSVFTPPSSCTSGDLDIEGDFMMESVRRFME